MRLDRQLKRHWMATSSTARMGRRIRGKSHRSLSFAENRVSLSSGSVSSSFVSVLLTETGFLDTVWPLSPVVVAVLKCATAYTLASLFTFVPALSALLSTSSETDAHGRVTRRPNYSAHMVATIVVYVNSLLSDADIREADIR